MLVCHWQATIAATRIIRLVILICWRFSVCVRIGHLDVAMDEWASAVTTTPAGVIKAFISALWAQGMAANFQIFNGRSFCELASARRQVDRLVIRNGAPIDTTLSNT